jgi:hypothetical protein
MGQIRAVGSMVVEVYEPDGGTQWPRRKCRCHNTGKRTWRQGIGNGGL